MAKRIHATNVDNYVINVSLSLKLNFNKRLTLNDINKLSVGKFVINAEQPATNYDNCIGKRITTIEFDFNNVEIELYQDSVFFRCCDIDLETYPESAVLLFVNRDNKIKFTEIFIYSEIPDLSVLEGSSCVMSLSVDDKCTELFHCPIDQKAVSIDYHNVNVESENNKESDNEFVIDLSETRDMFLSDMDRYNQSEKLLSGCSNANLMEKRDMINKDKLILYPYFDQLAEIFISKMHDLIKKDISKSENESIYYLNKFRDIIYNHMSSYCKDNIEHDESYDSAYVFNTSGFFRYNMMFEKFCMTDDFKKYKSFDTYCKCMGYYIFKKIYSITEYCKIMKKAAIF